MYPKRRVPRRNAKKVAKCDNCGRNINIKPHTKTDAKGIEWKWFKCIRCGTVFVISATDEALRKDIAEYESLVTEVNKAPDVNEAKVQKAQELLKANIARSREIQAENDFPF